MEPPAFVSYSRSDSEFAKRLVGDLKSQGVQVWLDQIDIRGGARWDAEIEKALDGSKEVLVILSAASVESQNVLDEINLALDEGKSIIPVLKNDCRVPFRIRRLQYVDFRSDYADGLRSLLNALLGNEGPPEKAEAFPIETREPVRPMKPLAPVKPVSGKPEWLGGEESLDVAKPFFMPIEDVFSITGRGTVVTGRIKRGVSKLGDAVEIVGSRGTRKVTITGIEMSKKLLKEGKAGDNVGILLRGIDTADVGRGDVLVKPDSIAAYQKFAAEVYMLSQDEGGRNTEVADGYRPQFYFYTNQVTGEAKLPKAVKLSPGFHVPLTVELVSPVAMEIGTLFAIREGDRTVGAGQVTRLG